MYTWQGSGTLSLESVRLLLAGTRLRASGRYVHAADPHAGTEAFSASFEASTDIGETAGRLLLRTTTAEDERQISLSRTEDGVWLVDQGKGGTRRTEFDGALTVDVAGAVTFNTLPLRRLGLHRKPGEHEIPVVYIDLPSLTVNLVRQTYRTVSVGEDSSVVNFTQDDFTADIVVDNDGVVIDYPGISRRV
jgi:hypothetical protein